VYITSSGEKCRSPSHNFCHIYGARVILRALTRHFPETTESILQIPTYVSKMQLNIILTYILCGLGIATRYGLEGPGIKSRWGTRFSSHVQTGPGAHPASHERGTRSISRG